MAMTKEVKEESGEYFTHPTAVIEEGADIGAGTKVWHHSHVRNGATIGQDCVMGKNVFIDEGAVIGNRVKIQNNVSVYRGVHLEDEVFLGPSAVLTNDLFPRAVNPDWKIVPTYLRRGASIGANATIVCGIEIGEWAMVGAGAVVTRDVQAQSLVLGNPARHSGWVCRCGQLLSRAEDMPLTECLACGRANGPFS
jgi:UDP-2-acetamido-3-amino-2,3-dideoxy-glucuronate N-acetyltransferase